MSATTTQPTTTEATRAAMGAYLEELATRGPYGRYFADDVAMTIVEAGQVARGPAAVEQAIRFVHEQAFDAQPRLKLLLADGDRAAIEAAMVGTHTGDFQGIPATGRRVDVPYSVAYDLRAGRITALRIYGLATGLMQQIGG